MKRQVMFAAACLAVAAGIGLSACGSANAPSEADSAPVIEETTGPVEDATAEDGVAEQVLKTIAEGWQARRDYTDEHQEQTLENLRGAVAAELGHDEALKDDLDTGSTLAAQVDEYIDLLAEQKSLLEAATEADQATLDAMAAIDAKRYELLSEFREDYDLPIRAKYIDAFGEETSGEVLGATTPEADAARSLARGVKWEVQSDGTTWRATVTNTTDITFTMYILELTLYDAEDEKLFFNDANVGDWAPGADATFEVEADPGLDVDTYGTRLMHFIVKS